MDLAKLEKQSERMEGFREGYMACLNWVAAHLEQERKAEEAARKAQQEQPNESVSQA